VKVEQVGHAALEGWREKAADAVAPRVAQRSRIAEDQIRAALGLVFLGLTVKYLVTTTRRLLRQG
jgi:hypothetical protein